MTRPVIHYTRCPSVPTISALAEAWGTLRAEFAEEHDVDIVFQSVGFSPKTEYDHKDRFWLRNAGHAPAIWKKSHGVDCKVVGLAFLDGRYPVLSLHSSGLAQPAALKGRRLAVFYNPDSPFDLMIAQQLKIYQTTLATVGLGLDDVELVRIPRTFPPRGERQSFLLAGFQSALAALEEGIVDAVAASIPPDGGLYPRLNVVYDTRLAPDLISRVHPSVLRGLVVSTALIEEQRDLLVRIVATLVRTAERAATQPLDALRALATDLGQAPENLAAVYENIAQGIRLDLNDDYVATLDAQKTFLLRQGLIKKDFDLESWIDRSILADATALAQRAPQNAAVFEQTHPQPV
ncbi:ABC transporter substrate-binding protein [Acetobacter sp. DsW_54]|uniref:ABC transporter substrate-binding protein n=1 Tax=Acetobacter sp. DsW_54 TaxID=1670660 RepID=UPI000A37831E|nr:ABC transporter substrate-binding protein [Acetobacter sp. DsW_54]OUI98200.1 hypothetical protein HK20_07440 [Acetobacter sp. DsW_54]